VHQTRMIAWQEPLEGTYVINEMEAL